MQFIWQNIIAVGAGGFFGATTRFYINIIVTKNFPYEIPLATLSVNIFGSFVIGALTAVFFYYTPSEWLKLFLITGFLGALTTYSAFAIETLFLLNASFWSGLLNIAINLFGSIFAVFSGHKLLLYFLR